MSSESATYHVALFKFYSLGDLMRFVVPAWFAIVVGGYGFGLPSWYIVGLVVFVWLMTGVKVRKY